MSSGGQAHMHGTEKCRYAVLATNMNMKMLTHFEDNNALSVDKMTEPQT
jgi:hypothetical protein